MKNDCKITVKHDGNAFIKETYTSKNEAIKEFVSLMKYFRAGSESDILKTVELRGEETWSISCEPKKLFLKLRLNNEQNVKDLLI